MCYAGRVRACMYQLRSAFIHACMRCMKIISLYINMEAAGEYIMYVLRVIKLCRRLSISEKALLTFVNELLSNNVTYEVGLISNADAASCFV